MRRQFTYKKFVDGESYPLFKFIIDDQIQAYFEKIKISQDKEEIWELKKSINTLTKLVDDIETISEEKEEEE